MTEYFCGRGSTSDWTRFNGIGYILNTSGLIRMVHQLFPYDVSYVRIRLTTSSEKPNLSFEQNNQRLNHLVQLRVVFWLSYSTCADSSNERAGPTTIEDLVETNELATVMFSISNKYNLTEKIDKTCINEISKNVNLIPYYIANITLVKATDLLRFYWRNEYREYRGNELSFMKEIYINRTKVVDDYEQYYRSLKIALKYSLAVPDDVDICFSGSNCGCVSRTEFRNYESKLNYFKDQNTMRTESNLLIYNLCAINFLTLLVYLPIHYFCSYHLYDVDDRSEFIGAQIFIVSVNTLTILFLNIQRYFDVSRILNTNSAQNHLTPTARCSIYMTIIWGSSAVLGLCFAFMRTELAEALQSLLYFLVYVFVFSIVLAVFNSMTARKLQRAAEQGRNSEEFQHLTGASLILALTIVFYISHVLFFTYSMFEVVMGNMMYNIFNYVPLAFRIIIFTLHMIYFSYAWFNILILYKASSTYRDFFRMYLFRCWHKQETGQYVTMSSVQNNETQD
ncbi:hypothetical protein C0J52_22023 [Blattella germanica]|nr:hypothetical protein C0J52_22023 [Blattella germanica]